jgi:hypothetical protein
LEVAKVGFPILVYLGGHERRSENRHWPYAKTLGTSEENPYTAIILVQKDKKMETATAQNSTFANCTSHAQPNFAKVLFFCLRTLMIQSRIMYLANNLIMRLD